MKINTVFLLLIGLAYSCVESFEPAIDKDDSVDMLVVDGLITNQPGPYEVYLSRTAPLGGTFEERPEQGAIVTIYDNAGNQEVLVEGENGVYRTKENGIKGEVGREYTLHIVTSDMKEYESEAVEITSVPVIDQLRFEEIRETNYNLAFPKEEQFLEIYLDSDGTVDECKYYKWTFEETWEYNILVGEVIVPEEQKKCWRSNVSRTILVSSKQNQIDSKVCGFKITKHEPRQQKLRDKYSIKVNQYSINEELYNFFQRLQEVNEEGGSLYDEIPTAVFGNVYSCNVGEKVLGCFQASAVTTKRIFINRSDHSIKTVYPFENCIYDTIPNIQSYVDAYVAKYGEIYLLGEYFEFGISFLVSGRHEACVDCRVKGTSERPPFWE